MTAPGSPEQAQPCPERRSSPTDVPQPGIWVAASADALSGTWWDAWGTVEQLRARIGEAAIFDTVDFGSFTVQPTDCPEVVVAVAGGIREHGLAFAAWAEFHDADHDMLALFAAHYLAHYDSLEAFGMELAGGDRGEIAKRLPDRIAPYVQVDFRAIAEEELHGTRVIALPDPQGGFWLFRGPDGESTDLGTG